MPTFTLFADQRADITDIGADVADVIFDKVEALKPYLDYIWVGKLVVKVAARTREFIYSGRPIYEIVVEDRPIRAIEYYKLRNILERRFFTTSPWGSIVVVGLPMWEKDP